MRTTTAAWTAALAVMSMRGPFTTAEAAPARHHDQERPHHVIPKHIRRGGYNSSAPAVESTTSDTSTSQHRTLHESETDAISPPPVVDQTTRTKRTRSDTQTSPSDDEMLSSFLAEGLLPMTANTVVTTTLTVARNQQLHRDAGTYTLTYTETGPAKSSITSTSSTSSTTSKTFPIPVPLVTSTSLPLGTAPVPVPVPQDTTSTKSTRRPAKSSPKPSDTSTSDITLDNTALPYTAPAPSSVSYRAGNSSNPYYQPTGFYSSSLAPLSSSVPTSSDGFLGLPPLGGTHAITDLTGILPTPTHTGSEQQESDTFTTQGTGLPLLGTNGIIPFNEPSPTRHHKSTGTHTRTSDSTTDGGPIIVGLTSAFSLPNGSPKLHHGRPTDSALLSQLGLTGAPTGVSLPTGVPSLPTDLTKQIPTATGIFPPQSDALPTGGSMTNGGILPPGVTSDIAGATGALSTMLPDATTTATDLGSMLPTGQLTSDLSLGTSLPSGGSTLISNVIPTGGTSMSVPTALTVTGAGATMTVPLPTNSVGTSVTLTGPDGTTTVPIPVPVTTGTYTTSGSTTGGTTSTASYTDGTTTGTSATTTGSDTTSTASGYGSTVSTSVGLNSGTTFSVGATGSTLSSYVQPTSSAATKTSSPTDTSSLSTGTVQSTTAAATTQHTTAPETIQPTGTDTYTSLVLPTSWTFAPTGTETPGIATAPVGSNSAPSGLPTYMPQLVQPPGGLPVAPSNATLIQIGFNYGLNYPFVVNQPQSASQIFAYLPEGIAYGLGVSRDQVMMNSLRPYDTSSSLNYITTLAEAYVPSQLVNQLEMSLHMPLSEVYNNPESPVKTLMHMINPTIPILPGASVDGSSSSAWYNPAATATSSTGDGAPIGGDSGSSNKVRGTSVGIGVGAVCGAAVYAAAMVYVARRYRKKKALHQRASSVPTAGEMSQASGGMGGFFMSGANGRGSAGSGSGGRGSRTSAGSSNGRSVREQGISAPIMAENSLGWT